MQGTTTKKLLFHRQPIITAIRLGRLVNLNPGITLWHQGEELVLCACTQGLELNIYHSFELQHSDSCSSERSVCMQPHLG